MASTFTLRFLKDWQNGDELVRKGERALLSEDVAKELVKKGIAIITGNRTAARETAVRPEVETRSDE